MNLQTLLLLAESLIPVILSVVLGLLGAIFFFLAAYPTKEDTKSENRLKAFLTAIILLLLAIWINTF